MDPSVQCGSSPVNGRTAMRRVDERRRLPRLPLSLHATVRDAHSEQQWEAQTENISADGVCFTAEASFELGEVVEIEIDLEDVLGSSLRSRSLVCLGRVVQAESEDPAARLRYGCRILDYTIGSRALTRVCGAEAVFAATR